jgi:hypothetical protein
MNKNEQPPASPLPKKTTKAEKRASAQKTERRNKIIALGVCVSVAVILIALTVYAFTRPEIGSRVYATGGQSVTLYDNGRFRFLDCRFVRTGRYAETVDGGTVTVEFVHNNRTVRGSISGGILTIPAEWDSGKGHSPHLRLQ